MKLGNISLKLTFNITKRGMHFIWQTTLYVELIDSYFT